jgi:hypothetical protein
LDTVDEIALWTRIESVWWLAKEDVAIHKYSSLLESKLVGHNYDPPKHYKDDKTAWEITVIMANYFRRLLQKRVSKSPYYGIMVDETTDKSTNQQLIIYIKFLDKDSEGDWCVAIEYLDLVSPESASALNLTVCVLQLLVND